MMRQTESSATAGEVLAQVVEEVVTVLGDEVTPNTVRVDVDVFDGAEPVVADRWLDSMDLVEVVAALEARFGVDMAALVTSEDPVTLADVARHIAQDRNAARPQP